MSMFGGRVPQIIQQPYAQSDAGNVGLDFGQGLAQALGVVSQTFQAQGQNIAQQNEDAEMAQRLKVGATEIEQAKTRLEIARQQRANLDVHLQTEEERKRGDQLANLELFGVRAALSGMPEDEQAKWLAEHPVHDAKNASVVARSLGDSLAASKMTEVFQAIAGNPEINVTDLVTQQMAGVPFDQLHPEAAMEFRESLLKRAVGYKIEQTNNIVQKREAEGRRKATERAQTRVLSHIADDVALGPEEPGSLWAAILDEQAINRRDTTATAVGEAAADHIGAAVDRSLQVAGGDPTKIAKIQSWLKKATTGDDQVRRTARESLKAYGVYDVVDNALKDSLYKEQQHQISALRSGIDDAANANNLIGMQLMKADAKRLGQMDYWESRNSKITALDMELKGARSFMRGETDKKPQLSTAAVNELYRSDGIEPVLRNFGVVPTDFVKDIRENISAGNLPDAAAMVRAIDQFDPREAERITSAIGDDAMPVQLFTTMTRGMDENSAASSRYFGVLINNSDAVKHAQMALGKFAMDKATGEPGVPLVPSAQDALGQASGLSSSANIGPEATRAFKDFYSFRFIEAMQKNGGDPAAAVDETVLASVLASAKNDLARSYVTVAGEAIPADTFGIGSNASPEHGAKANLEDAIAGFRARMEGFDAPGIFSRVGDAIKPSNLMRFGALGPGVDAAIAAFSPQDSVTGIGAKVLVNRAVNFGGKAYIPAVMEDADGTVRPIEYMVWDVNEQKATKIDATKPFPAHKQAVDVLNGVFTGKIDKRELDPAYLVMWRDDYGTRSLKEYNAQTGGQFAPKIKAAVVDKYVRMYGPLPSESMRNSDIPAERRAYMEQMKNLDRLTAFFAERWGWSLD